MPDLSFTVEAVEAAIHGLTPMLKFALRVANDDPGEQIQGSMVHAQVQIQPARRRYTPKEKERLVEMFGTPDRWSQTLRNRLWTHVDTTLQPFAGEIRTSLWIPCSFDLNVAATKYFYALEDGDVSLLFLFSGTVFYRADGGALQMERISWEKECTFALPIATWKTLMEAHYPNSGWLTLRRDVLEKVYAYKRDHGLTGWDETLEKLLSDALANTEIPRMNSEKLKQIVDAVLYEGHILYPYRPTSRKNRQRFTFGRVYPEAYAAAQSGAEPCIMQTQCLLLAADTCELEISTRFLQPVTRDICTWARFPSAVESSGEPPMEVVPVLEVEGNLYQGWQEAVERQAEVLLKPGSGPASVSISWPASRTLETIRNQAGDPVGAVVRHHPAIDGVLEAAIEPLGGRLHRVTMKVTNRSTVPSEFLENADEVLLRTLTSTHGVLQACGGEFLSMTDPPADYAAAAAECRNIGAWPVLVGDEALQERDTVLSSPIILSDYPQIAAESAGSLFDGLEIDEILTLRILTMTDEEKGQMRTVDDHARRILDRTEGLTGETVLRMHGAMRQPSPAEVVFGGNSRLESARVGGLEVRAGDRVRLQPRARADIMDIALSGKSAVVEAVEQDAEGRVHFAVVIEDDPGRDLGMLRQPGHRFFFGADEVQVLEKEGRP